MSPVYTSQVGQVFLTQTECYLFIIACAVATEAVYNKSALQQHRRRPNHRLPFCLNVDQ